MPFSITPLLDMPPPEAQEFPNFIQFQADGADLGSNDADTLNFSTGLTATRGTGENSNVVTVTAGDAPPPAVSSAGYLSLQSNPDPSGPIMSFNGNFFYDQWVTATAIVPMDEWDWDSNTNGIVFNETGVYRIIVTSFMQAENEWPDGSTTYGAQVGPDTSVDASASVQARHHADASDSATRMRWTDQFMLQISDIETFYPAGLYAIATNSAAGVLFAGMEITIERLGDLPA